MDLTALDEHLLVPEQAEDQLRIGAYKPQPLRV
jgi:hypothetical protein